MIITRAKLIEQLRQALYELERPENDSVQFEIHDTEFTYDFDENGEAIL